MRETSRRDFLAAGAVAGTTLVAGETLAKPALNTPTPKLLHQVFFWLRNPASVADRAQLIAGITSLATIETVRLFHVGVPASTERRAVVDDSYHVAELLGFDDVAGQNAYQAHPLHQRFVAEHEHLWRRAVVYDAMAVE